MSIANFEIRIPQWLDDFIFKELGACYSPAYDRFAYNLDLNKDEAKVYLGTYFPRSYAEGYYIFNTILKSSALYEALKEDRLIKVLDFGCGSGGEFFGLLQALDENINKKFHLQLTAIDGNHNSLRILDQIAVRYNQIHKHRIEVSIAPYFIENESDLSDIAEIVGTNFDFLITSKAICELEKKKRIEDNGYEFFLSLFAPLISQTGILSIVDVTIYDNYSKMFLPQRLNLGVNRYLAKNSFIFKSIAPCSGRNGDIICSHLCFHQIELRVSHSAKRDDKTKIAFRLITRDNFNLDETKFQNTLSNSNCIYL